MIDSFFSLYLRRSGGPSAKYFDDKSGDGDGDNDEEQTVKKNSGSIFFSD